MEIHAGIFTFDNFITEEEGDKFIAFIENKIKINDIINFTESSGAINDRYSDIDLANIFFERVKLQAPDNLKDKLIKPNDLIYWSKYTPNSMFGLHTDTGLYFNNKERLRTRYTLLIYLNDNYDEGETVFYNDAFIETIRIKPEKYKCVVFDIDLFHKGTTVKNGKKYWMGCELVGHF